MRIAIAGAGNVGRAIARELLDNGHQVLLIDRDPKALKIDSVPDAEWLMADACEIAALDNAQLNKCQVLVAATGDDKVNLVTALLGKTEYGVPRVVARINHPKNEWLFDSSWGVDVAVSTPRIISALVEEAVSVGDVVRLFSFRKGQANLVELTLPDSSMCIGKTVEEITLQMMHHLPRSFAMAECLLRPQLMFLALEMNCSLLLPPPLKLSLKIAL